MSDSGRGGDDLAAQFAPYLLGFLALAAVATVWDSRIKPWGSKHLAQLRAGDLAAPVLGAVSWADVLGVAAIMVPVLALGLWARQSLKARGESP